MVLEAEVIQPLLLEQLSVLDQPVVAFLEVLYATTLADSTRQSPRQVLVRVVAQEL
jgi:hypothetical protein